MWSWSLFVISVVGLWATGSKKRWGWVAGFFSEWLWIAYGIASAQYGFIAMSAVFAVIHVRNWLKWRPDR